MTLCESCESNLHLDCIDADCICATSAAHRLQCAMSDLSEEAWCATWLIGLEDLLWRWAHQGGPLGRYHGDAAEDGARLLALYREVGGWWTWVFWPVFVPAAEWEARNR